MLGGNQPNRKDIDDDLVEEFIELHPGGASYEEIAQVMGFSRERCAQIVREALSKCLRRAQLRGISLADIPPTRETTWDRLGT